MDQEPVNYPNQPPVTPTEPVETFCPPEMQPEKKSHKKLFLIGAIIALIVIAVLGYLSFGRPQTTSKTTTTSGTSQVVNPVEDAAAEITDSVANESTLTDTDDSKLASDASNVAGNVGDSINENNY